MLLLILLEEVRCIPENISCELYMVKFREEWCETHLVVTQFLNLGMLLGSSVFLFMLYCTFNIVCLKILPNNVRCAKYLSV